MRIGAASLLGSFMLLGAVCSEYGVKGKETGIPTDTGGVDTSVTCEEIDADGDGSNACNDCNDAVPTIYPGAIEIACDDIDQDCDGKDAELKYTGTQDWSTANATLYGLAPYDETGSALAPAGDINADGYDDIIIGAYGNSSYNEVNGAAFVVYGPQTGIINLTDANATFYSKDYYGALGVSVAGIGDDNHDGYADILIGSPGEDDGVGSSTGIAYLIHGPVSGSMILDRNTDAWFVGNTQNDRAGYSVAEPGDVNGDGNIDYLIGAPFTNISNLTGTAYLVYGPVTGEVDLGTDIASTGVTFKAENYEDYAAYTVAGGGDVDGDGSSEILIGAWKNDRAWPDAGTAYLFHNPSPGTISLSEADAIFEGSGYGTTASLSMANNGDVNGDGYDDILIGEPSDSVYADSSDGAAYLIYGPDVGDMDTLLMSDARIIGNFAAGFVSVGRSVAIAGDTDNDGFDDIMVGATNYRASEAGSAVRADLIYGPISSFTTYFGDEEEQNSAHFTGEPSTETHSIEVSSAGDINKDGFYDFMFSETFVEDGGAAEAGRVNLFYGIGCD